MIVDPRMQGALVVRVVAYWLFSVLAVGLILMCWDLALGPWGPFFAPHRLNALWDRYAPMIVASILILPVVLADAVLMSNRIVAPLDRVRGRMRALAAGETVEPLSFGKHDPWDALAADFNAVVDYNANLKQRAEAVDAVQATSSRELIEIEELEPAGVS